jgi:hypothetical protein
MIFFHGKQLTRQNLTLREEGAESGGSLKEMAELPKDESSVSSAFLF